jgi:SAM-dependent methyltransferase
MNDVPWYERFFGEDYLRIYEPFLSPEKSEQEAGALLRLLKLPPGSAILDLCCGYGRHVLELAKRGYQMTGLDMNANFLQRGRQAAEDQHLNVRWLQSDMRHIPFEQAFDAIINLFTSFGYLANEEEDQKVLHQIQHALKPGGLFLLETIYQPRVLRTFSPHGVTRYHDGLIVVEERHIDLLASRNEVQITLIFPNGQRHEQTQSIRIYTLTELARMLHAAGLELKAYYGDLDGSPLKLDSRLVIVSQKPAQNTSSSRSPAFDSVATLSPTSQPDASLP